MSILVHWFLRCQFSILHLLLKFTLNHGLNVPVKVTQFCLPFQARILKWGAIPFFRGSSQPSVGTQVSHIAARFFTSWATRETQHSRVLCNFVPYDIGLYFYHETHPQLSFFFFFPFFGPVTPFFLALFLCSSHVAHWTATNRGWGGGGLLMSLCHMFLMKQSFF